jgi:hypothetical protein
VTGGCLCVHARDVEAAVGGACATKAASAPVLGENYFLAPITADRLGADQPAAVKEFE